MIHLGSVLPRKSCTLLLMVPLLLALAIFGADTTSADSGSRDYQWLVASGPLCELPMPDPCPAIARAPNGDTIALTGAGTFSIHPKSVGGGGEFVHEDAEGNVVAEGTWEATQLLGFHSYGNGIPQELPEEFEGGLLLMRVEAFIENERVASGILRVTCVVGDKIPASAHEGIRLNARGLNFNQEVSGLTLYIRQ
jgi:hypothetical protein